MDWRSPVITNWGTFIVAVLDLISVWLIAERQPAMTPQLHLIDWRFIILLGATLLTAAAIVAAAVINWKTANINQSSVVSLSHPVAPTVPIEELKPRLSIRITDGLVDRQSNDAATMVILLNVRVDGEASEIKGWHLELCHGGKKRITYQQPIRRPLTYHCLASVNEQRPGTITEAEPIPSHVPDKGWILFTVPGVAKEFDDYVFGATFTLTAVEENLGESTLEKPTGEWLHRASIGD